MELQTQQSTEQLNLKNCKQRVRTAYNNRYKEIKKLYKDYCNGIDDNGLNEYALSFDYVRLGTFEDQNESYFRYQISWGGPSEEFRIFVGIEGNIYKIEFWFLDWCDGAKVTVKGKRLEFLKELFMSYCLIDKETIDYIIERS